ncbi:MAG: thioredoxin domain-containing protein [Candidatus Magasanikbacteria bacterium]|nr:thioredoxin domain-containing protein [Candidatus Magasanikbacteria bacterium]
MSSSHAAPNNQRTLLIWTIVAVVALIAVFIGIDSASKQKPSPATQTRAFDAVTESDQIKGGNFSSPVTIVEYSDFQCPACAAYYPIAKKILETNGTNVQFVYRYFPLQALHPNAFGAAQAAQAAGTQNKFWEMHDLLFERQKEWSAEKNIRDIMTRYAGELGLNVGQFIADYENPETKTRIDRDYQSGARAGVEGTPTFFINGAKIDNPRSYDEFQKLIDRVVAKKS